MLEFDKSVEELLFSRRGGLITKKLRVGNDIIPSFPGEEYLKAKDLQYLGFSGSSRRAAPLTSKAYLMHHTLLDLNIVAKRGSLVPDF